MLLHLSFSFLHITFLLAPYGYVSIESINYILLSSFEVKSILLVASVKHYAFHFCKLFWSSLRISTLVFFFVKQFVFPLFELLLNSFYNLQIKFFFSWYTFLCLFLFRLHHCCLLNSYMILVLIQKILLWLVQLIHLALIPLLSFSIVNPLLISKFEVSNRISISFAISL